ncbi:helix-turn-helix domain-containing protein [Bradyrhizobium sp. 87]|nr:helix-turn-helix domain-containing protein [Bradyrhizobium sp. 87]
MAKRHDTGLSLALKAMGTAEKLATELRITPQAVSQWEKVPLTRVFDVERATGISRHQLRPDFFGERPEAMA